MSKFSGDGAKLMKKAILVILAALAAASLSKAVNVP
jgi:hypothetical protein